MLSTCVFSGGQVIAEYLNGAAPTAPTREYVYSGAQLLATLEGGTTKYHHADHLSVRLTTDATGVIMGQQGHFPYGESWYASGTTTKWLFTNYERDTESGNDYAIGRTYINRFGRFSSPDPVEAIADKNPQAVNRYVYVTGDPINRTDPTGTIPRIYEVANTGWGDLNCMVFSFQMLGDFSLCGGGGGGGFFGDGGSLLGPTICVCGDAGPPITVRGALCVYACICSNGLPNIYAFQCDAGSPKAFEPCPPSVIILTGIGRRPQAIWPLPLC